MVSSLLKSYIATYVFLEIRFFCHSPKHSKLIWPWNFQNLVGGPEQIYRRTSIPKYDFNKVAKQFYINHNSVGCSPVNWLHIFRIPFPENTSGGLLLNTRSDQLYLPVFVNGTF